MFANSPPRTVSRRLRALRSAVRLMRSNAAQCWRRRGAPRSSPARFPPAESMALSSTPVCGRTIPGASEAGMRTREGRLWAPLGRRFETRLGDLAPVRVLPRHAVRGHVAGRDGLAIAHDRAARCRSGHGVAAVVVVDVLVRDHVALAVDDFTPARPCRVEGEHE